MFPFLRHGAHKKNSLNIDTFPFSNLTRNRIRTAADYRGFGHKSIAIAVEPGG